MKWASEATVRRGAGRGCGRGTSELGGKTKKIGRMAPKRETVRRLFALSGNQCARPGCGTVLLAASGTLVGEICHIAAENPGGPRYDASLTPDQRRSFENLLLLCSTCHALIDGEPDNHPADVLRSWKRAREAIFEAAGDSLRRAYVHEIADEKDHFASSLPRHLKRFRKHMAKLGREPAIDKKTPKELASYAKRLGNLTAADRQLVAAIVEKAIDIGGHDDWYGVTIHPDDLKTLLIDRKRLSDHRIAKLGETLDRHGLGSIDVDDRVPRLFVTAPHDGVSWTNLKTFADARGVGLAAVLRDLRFGILD